MTQPSIGLALGSGVARGWAHIGVIRALEAEGLKPEIVCGTSIGALVGGVYLAGRLTVLESWARGLGKASILRYLDMQFGGGGLVAGKRLRRLLDDNLGDTLIETLAGRFAAVTTELGTGHEIWLQHGRLVDAVAASYALPGVFSPVKVDGRWLIDGALVNPVPVSVCRALGARLVIAVNLNGDVFGKGNVSGEVGDETTVRDLLARLRQNPKRALSPSNMVAREIFGHGRKGAPSIFSVMVGSLNIAQDRLSRSRLAGDPPDVTVTPRLGHVGLLEFDKAEEAIAAGEAATKAAMPHLIDALAVLA